MFARFNVAFVEPLMRPSSVSAALLKYHCNAMGCVPEMAALNVPLLVTMTAMFVGGTSNAGGVKCCRCSTRLPASEP